MLPSSSSEALQIGSSGTGVGAHRVFPSPPVSLHPAPLQVKTFPVAAPCFPALRPRAMGTGCWVDGQHGSHKHCCHIFFSHGLSWQQYQPDPLPPSHTAKTTPKFCCANVAPQGPLCPLGQPHGATKAGSPALPHSSPTSPVPALTFGQLNGGHDGPDAQETASSAPSLLSPGFPPGLAQAVTARFNPEQDRRVFFVKSAWTSFRPLRNTLIGSVINYFPDVLNINCK